MRAKQPTRADIERQLAEAADACFFTGVGDLAEELCKANVRFSIAKIRFVQAALGIEPDACFVGAPDATVTRNIPRWTCGFGYGGRIRYSGGFALMDVRSNCCGMFLGAIDAPPEAVSLLDRVRELSSAGRLQAETGTSWDFGTSNHFVSVLRFEQEWEGRSHAILIHGSGPELRDEGPHGPGLYMERSTRLAGLARTVETPWGPLAILDGPGVQEYRAGYVRAEQVSRHRRRLLAEALFPVVAEISNTTHQGAGAVNDYHLGCLVDTLGAVVPLALRADLPVYLVEQLPNLERDVAEKLGLAERADRMGLWPWVAKSNLLPHGGGYTVPGYRCVRQVLEAGGTRIFALEVGGSSGAVAYHTSFRHVPFGYRGEEVVRRVEELRLGRVVGRALPVLEFMV
ncbi:MAG: hypothetical protein FJ109_16030 [Deltaproteobacteria bacterium]|nr:hypothetical protein [Deltaproteobacteria bacterium]